jgi:hypothetical protein
VSPSLGNSKEKNGYHHGIKRSQVRKYQLYQNQFLSVVGGGAGAGVGMADMELFATWSLPIYT